MCAQAGFAFVPFALSNSKGAQKLIRMVYAAVRDVCDEFYWYGTLVPRHSAAAATTTLLVCVATSLRLARTEKA